MAVEKVCWNITVEVIGGKAVEIYDSESDGSAYIEKEYLPALLDRLNAAAEAMQIPTKQGELAALLREMIEVFDGYELAAALPLDLRERAEQAIAKADR